MAESAVQLIDALDDDADFCMGIYLAAMQLVELYETGRAGTAIVLMVKDLEERLTSRACDVRALIQTAQHEPRQSDELEPSQRRPQLKLVELERVQ